MIRFFGPKSRNKADNQNHIERGLANVGHQRASDLPVLIFGKGANHVERRAIARAERKETHRAK